MKYIIVTGGVISGLGKGITASSIGLLLKSLGLKITTIKIDPYLNIDAGTMSPYEHGECYVLADGGEVDLDLGNYERFLGIELGRNNNITTGKIYSKVLEREREGKYLGKTVQVVPHIVNEIQDWIIRVSAKSNSDVCIIELGGTIGDIETAPFIEALRRLDTKDNMECCFVHVSLIVDNGDVKTKPTQQSIRQLRSLGIVPDFLVLRTKSILDSNILDKLRISCSIKENHIICNIDVPNIYFVPELFKNQGFCQKIAIVLDLKINRKYELTDYYKILNHYKDPEINNNKIRVGIAGKYLGSQDTYLSLIRAIEHASFNVGKHIEIVWVDTEDVINLKSKLNECDRIIIPGGFGSRGINGKLKVCQYCRENNVKTLGICLGMQVMVVEFARFLGYENACSSEWIDNNEFEWPMPIIDILPNQNGKMGGTMRLGNYKTFLKTPFLKELYGEDYIIERHRHRYELSTEIAKIFHNSKMEISGLNNEGNLVEIVRLMDHPYFLGCQFHPEFRSRFDKPHPLFIKLLE